MRTNFEWDEEKDAENAEKHNVSFHEAQQAFLDPRRLILEDLAHSEKEKRFYCVGEIEKGICTVRFTYRDKKIRIFGAGIWRKGKRDYEKENSIHG